MVIDDLLSAAVAVVTNATNSQVNDLPDSILSTESVNLPLLLTISSLVETNFKPVGNISCTFTFVDAKGPLLNTVIEYVIFSPVFTLYLSTFFFKLKSADWMQTVAESVSSS